MTAGSPNLQDIFIGGKLLWEGKLPHSEKQDGRHGHFFENNRHFSTG